MCTERHRTRNFCLRSAGGIAASACLLHVRELRAFQSEQLLSPGICQVPVQFVVSQLILDFVITCISIRLQSLDPLVPDSAGPCCLRAVSCVASADCLERP